ncbi:hypothetical protein Tco_1138416, partial [Tanacetum coccineum]
MARESVSRADDASPIQSSENPSPFGASKAGEFILGITSPALKRLAVMGKKPDMPRNP